MFVESSPTTPLSKVLVTSNFLLSLPILAFPSKDDPSGDLDSTTFAAGIACPLVTIVTGEYAGITTVLFPYPDVRSVIHVAAVPVAVTDEGKDSWEEESKGA